MGRVSASLVGTAYDLSGLCGEFICVRTTRALEAAAHPGTVIAREAIRVMMIFKLQSH